MRRPAFHGITQVWASSAPLIGVFQFPLLSDSLGRHGTLLLTAGMAVLGFALTLELPEPAGRSLEDWPTSTRDTSARTLRVASQHRPTEDPASAA
jgi:hypothetical protein